MAVAIIFSMNFLSKPQTLAENRGSEPGVFEISTGN